MPHATRRAVVLGVLCAVAACASAEDLSRERAEEIERRYKVAWADARRIESDHPELATPEAFDFYERTASALGLTRLRLEDVTALAQFVQSPAREELAGKLTRPEVVERVAVLRESVGYEPSFREATALIESARAPLAPGVTDDGTRDAVALVRARAPLARLPLAAVPSVIELGRLPRGRIEAALERFARLEIDLGVHELDGSALALLATIASDPARSYALALLLSELPALRARGVYPEALAQVARIGSSALATTLGPLAGTRAFKPLAVLDVETATVLEVLATRPRASALLSVLEDASPELSFRGPADARALVAIDAASPTGQAREHLGALLRGRVAVDALDEPGAQLLRDLAASAGMRDAVRALHDAWHGWVATPRDREVLAILASAPELGPLARALRKLGLDFSERRLREGEARALASLATHRPAELASALHVTFPKLLVRDEAALRELEELAKAGITGEQVLQRLDANWLSGRLDATKRAQIVQKLKGPG